MTVAPGLLDRRLTFYEPRDGGGDGFVRTVYVETGTWWGRLDDTASNETVPLSPQNHIEGRITATATVADYVPVPLGGVVREAGNDMLYHVRGVVPRRALRRQDVAIEAIAPTDYGTYTLYDAVDVLDGIHLVTPGTIPNPPDPVGAFSSAFSSAFDIT